MTVYYGTSSGETLSGGNDDDVFWPLAGDDIIIGGDGDDAVFYTERYYTGPAYVGGWPENGVYVDLSAGEATYSIGGVNYVDTLSSIEEVYGTDDGDTFIGDDNDNYFTGLKGADSYDGADGFDTVSFFQDVFPPDLDSHGVYVNLDDEIAFDAYGNMESIVNMEGLRGTYWDDVLIGDEANNSFIGFDGDDFIDGGRGDDLVRYDRDLSFAGQPNEIGEDPIVGAGTDGVTVNLDEGYAIDGYGATDTLISIENVRGSRWGDDDITGDRGANVLQGRGGDDVLEGLGGNDELYGEIGNDTLSGGLGKDLLDGGTAGNDPVDGLVIGDDILTGGRGADLFVYHDGHDTITDFEIHGQETIDVSSQGGIMSFLDLLAVGVQDGSDVVFTFSGDDSLTLLNTALDDLSTDDFFFA